MNRYRKRCSIEVRLAATTILVAVSYFLTSTSKGDTLVYQGMMSDPAGFWHNGTLGYSFATKNDPISITALGMTGTGTNVAAISDHNIGIWNETGQLLASVNILVGATNVFIEGQHRYLSLALPVVLEANQVYVIGASYGTNATPVRFRSTNTAHSPAIDLIGGRQNESPDFSFPSVVASPAIAVGPNAQFTVVPEPSILALFTFAGLLYLRLRAGPKE